MYLLDHMERGTPQRKTVYRISLTLVKKESLDGCGGKSGSSRRRDSGLLEQVKEVHNESEAMSVSHSFMRTFRTFSTGQLELGRLKVSRRLQKVCSPLVEDWAPVPGLEDPGGPNPVTCSGTAVEKRLLKTRRVEDQSSEPPVRSPSGTYGPPSSPLTPTLRPGLLRRSFRTRMSRDLFHSWTVSKDHDHCRSGSAQNPLAPRPSHPPMEKSRTLEVLNRTSSLTELDRCESPQGARNRTLDNSDLLDLPGGARSTNRRLTRLFSGIFFRRDRTSSLDPGRIVMSQSRSESANRGRTEGDRPETSRGPEVQNGSGPVKVVSVCVQGGTSRRF